MPEEQLVASPRRVTAISAAVVAVIAGSLGVTVWRFESAVSRSAIAIDAPGAPILTQSLLGSFWHERESIAEYIYTPSPAALAEVYALQRQFAATTVMLAGGDLAAEAGLRTQVEAKSKAFFAVFTGIQGTAGTILPHEIQADQQMVRAEPSVLGPLYALNRALEQ